MKRYVLDASALLLLLEGRAGAETVRRLLERAKDLQWPIYVSAVNWGEVYFVLCRNRGRSTADELMTKLANLPLTIVAADSEAAKAAASLRVRCALPYADGFAAALAISKVAVLVASDRHFDRVKDQVKLLRLR